MRPSLNILDKSLIERILDEAKRILSEVGMEIHGPMLRQRLLDSGLVTEDGNRIHFPHEVVDKAIASCPKKFTLFDRAGNPHAELGGNNVHFVPGSSGLKILDHHTGKTRLANTADFVEYVRLADGLPHIAYLATAFSTNDDIEANVSDAWRLYLCLTNSRKPIVSGAFTEHSVPRMAEMMLLFRQDRADLMSRPFSIFTITATGNFRYSEDSSQNLLDCVEWGIPIEITPVTLMGLIAPVTLVGATVFHTADVLAGLTMAQIIKPGAPVLFGGAPATFHMKAATSPMAAIEAQRLNMAFVSVAKYLDLPTQAYMALSDSKYLDAQAGAETFGSALLAALAGINSVSGPGMLDFVMVFSLAKLIFDDEVCGQALRLIREMEPVNDLPTVDLARELIDEGHLITAEHTLDNWPEQLYLPNPVIDRQNRENWTKSDRLSLIQRAEREVEIKLASYEPIDTDKRIMNELSQLIKSGLVEQEELPEVPEATKKRAPLVKKRRRIRRRDPN
jgi:trimethylamine--corrinoid protein Co-methyltransferase